MGKEDIDINSGEIKGLSLERRKKAFAIVSGNHQGTALSSNIVNIVLDVDHVAMLHAAPFLLHRHMLHAND